MVIEHDGVLYDLGKARTIRPGYINRLSEASCTINVTWDNGDVENIVYKTKLDRDRELEKINKMAGR